MRLGRWLAADVHVALAIALGVPVVVGEAVFGFVGSGPILALTTGYLALQLVLALTVGGAARGARGLARFLLAVAFVATLTLLETRTQPTLPVLYIPIMVLAAATSLRAGVSVAIAGLLASRLTTALTSGASAALAQSILPVVVVVFLVIGTRQVVSSLERSL